MIELDIPGKEKIQLAHLVSDVNGTLAINGILVDGVEILLKKLTRKIEIHLITANTHGQQEVIDRQLGLKAVILSRGDEAVQKAKYVEQLGQQKVIAIGQGQTMPSCSRWQRSVSGSSRKRVWLSKHSFQPISSCRISSVR